MKNITKFLLNKASYSIGVGENEAILELDYAGNSYNLVGQVVEKDMKIMAETVAHELLSRKHGVNFAYKFAKIGEEEK